MEKNIQKGTKGITLIALVITIIVLLILAGVTISQLTGSDSAPAKANEAAQKNAIGEAKDDVTLAVINAKTNAYENVYVGNGISAENSKTTVGRNVIQAIADKYATNNTLGKATITVDVVKTNNVISDDATISISTTDFEIEGTITLEDGVLTWGEIEANVPRIKGIPDSLTLKSGEKKEFKATLKGITGTINWKVEEGSAKFVLADESRATETIGENVKLEILDTANNNETVIITAKVEDKCTATCEITVEKILRAKDVIPVPTSSSTSAYVKYAMNGQTLENAERCRVLYNDPEHGLQIITANSVDDNVILGIEDNIGGAIGSTDLEKAQNSYNNLVFNLNQKAQNYVNTTDGGKINEPIVLDARCVGSKPTAGIIEGKTKVSFTNKNDEELLVNPNNYSFLDTYVEREYKGQDSNYSEDDTKMKNLGIYVAKDTSGSSNINYWLASREVNTRERYAGFLIYVANFTGSNSDRCAWNINYPYGTYPKTTTSFGFRPVFLINPTAPIDSGSGTEADPYILKVGN